MGEAGEAMGKKLVKFERLNDQPNNIGIKIVYNPNGLDSPLSRNDQIGRFYCPCNKGASAKYIATKVARYYRRALKQEGVTKERWLRYYDEARELMIDCLKKKCDVNIEWPPEGCTKGLECGSGCGGRHPDCGCPDGKCLSMKNKCRNPCANDKYGEEVENDEASAQELLQNATTSEDVLISLLETSEQSHTEVSAGWSCG